MLKSPVKHKSGSLTMKEMRLRLSPLKSGGSPGDGVSEPFGHIDESDPEEASLYQEPFRVRENSPACRKLVKNYSCGRLCDYEDFGSLNPGGGGGGVAKFGSTPLFNLPPSTSDRLIRKPTTSKSFSNNLYEKDYRKPCFEAGYSVPVSRSRQSLGRALSVPGPPETFYAATDIIKVAKINVGKNQNF